MGDVVVRKRKLGFTLIELLVVIAIIALLISILLPSLSRARELSKRLVCMSNIKGIGTSMKIYANDNSESFPIPPYDGSLLANNDMVEYTAEKHVDAGVTHIGQVGMDRDEESFSVDPNASTQVSVTRAFWMLVRSGDVTVKQFICPSSPDQEDPTENINLYYDFTDYSTSRAPAVSGGAREVELFVRKSQDACIRYRSYHHFPPVFSSRPHHTAERWGFELQTPPRYQASRNPQWA